MKPLVVSFLNSDVYWIVGVIFAFYYGVRGIRIQRQHTHNENVELKKKDKEFREWKQFDRIFVHYIQDFIYNSVCAAAGFIALYMEYRVLIRIHDLSDIGLGTAAMLVFLSIFSVLGIAGQLPFTLFHGKIFGVKS